MKPDRLIKLIDEREQLQRRLVQLDAEIAAGCRAYSDTEGYCIALRPEQVRRAIQAGAPGHG